MGWIGTGVRCWLAAFMLACNDTDARIDPSTTNGLDDGITNVDITGTDASTGDASTNDSNDSTALDPDGKCIDDSQCGALRCRDHRCDGCKISEDCPDDLLCWRDACYPADVLPECNDVVTPVCGDGKIDALEECEGGPGCIDCRRDDAIAPWIDVDDDAQDIFFAQDGSVFVRGSSLGRWAPDGTLDWSLALDWDVEAIESDPAGTIYLAGADAPTYELPRVDAWTASATPRWSARADVLGRRSVVAVDGTRLFVGGTTEQENSPADRGFVARYELDGTLLWSRKIAAWARTMGIVLDANGVTALGEQLYGPTVATLLRVDDAGETMWSLDVGIERFQGLALEGVIGDGVGGTWIFGEEDEGPLAMHHDASGAELETLSCFGATKGTIKSAAVASSGALAFGVMIWPGPALASGQRGWIAIIEDGIVTRGIEYDTDDTFLVPTRLAWRAEGRLLLGARSYYPNDGMHVLVVEPAR